MKAWEVWWLVGLLLVIVDGLLSRCYDRVTFSRETATCLIDCRSPTLLSSTADLAGTLTRDCSPWQEYRFAVRKGSPALESASKIYGQNRHSMKQQGFGEHSGSGVQSWRIFVYTILHCFRCLSHIIPHRMNIVLASDLVLRSYFWKETMGKVIESHGRKNTLRIGMKILQVQKLYEESEKDS